MLKKNLFPYFFSFLKEQYLPGFCDVWELELLPEHNSQLTNFVPILRKDSHNTFLSGDFCSI